MIYIHIIFGIPLMYYRFFVLVEALLLNIFLQGVVQPMIALTVAGVLCPVAAILVLICKFNCYQQNFIF